MEGGSDQTTSSFNVTTDLQDKAGAFSTGGNMDAWNANPMRLPIRKSYIISSNNMTDMRAAYFQFNVANRDSQTFGAAPVYPPPTFAAFPASSFGGMPLPITGRQLDFGRLFYGKGSMGLYGSMGRMLEPSEGQSNKTDVQPFVDSCQRRFVMFDCEGSKRRMIFQPALVSENSALVTPKSETAVAYDLDPSSDKDSSGKGKYVKYPSSALIAPLGAPISIHNPHTQPTSANLNFIPHTYDNFVSPFSALRDVAEANIGFNQFDFSVELSNFRHEDTEDLEALLSSDEDDMSSTGHSPSDITKQTSPIERHSSQVGNRCSSKRKKREWEDYVYADDVRSTGTSGNNIPKIISSQKLEGAGIEAAHSKKDVAHQVTAQSKCLGYTEEDLTAHKVVVSDELSSTSSANSKNCCNKRQGQQPDRQSKKGKIKSILHLLRGILPGGESMDASFVLDETIQYVKTLQFEVQKLQAAKVLKL